MLIRRSHISCSQAYIYKGVSVLYLGAVESNSHGKASGGYKCHVYYFSTNSSLQNMDHDCAFNWKSSLIKCKFSHSLQGRDGFVVGRIGKPGGANRARGRLRGPEGKAETKGEGMERSPVGQVKEGFGVGCRGNDGGQPRMLCAVATEATTPVVGATLTKTLHKKTNMSN